MKRTGPGVRPQMNSPAIMTADVGDPGIPSVIIGTSDATPAASAADCGPMIPEISPLPKFSLVLEDWRGRPEPRKDAAGAPCPGKTPEKEPMNELDRTRGRAVPSSTKRSRR